MGTSGSAGAGGGGGAGARGGAGGGREAPELAEGFATAAAGLVAGLEDIDGGVTADFPGKA